MVKSFETLIQDIQKLFDDGKILSSAVEQFSEKLSKTLIQRFKEHQQERKPTLRLSSIGKPLRQLWYELKGFKPERLSAETKLKFLYGDVIEAIIILLIEESGHSILDQQAEVSIDGVKGHIDGVVDNEVLIDVKSTSTFSFEKFKTGKILEDDPFGYVFQLASYAKAERFKRCAFLAIDKQLGRMCVYELPKRILDTIHIEERINDIREVIKSDSAPPRCYSDKSPSKDDKSGNRILDTGCAYCGWKEYCWRESNEGSGLQVRYYSTGPRWFTKLVKEPKLRNNYNKEETYEQFPIKE